jgi:hypothetical protein
MKNWRKKMQNDLMVVKQLPVIEEQLKTLSTEIMQKVTDAVAMECTEDTVKEIKKIRTDLNKDAAFYETGRKEIKTAILKPYEDFEESYKKYVGDKYKFADAELKKKIETVENDLKAKKQEEIEAYFNEYLQSKNIDFITFANTGIAVTLSASIKSLKEQAKAFIDRICEDLTLIESHEYKDEIMVEYKQNLRAAFSITMVQNRHKAIEVEQAKSTENEQIKAQEQMVVEKVESFTAPVEDEPIIKITFTAWATKTQFKELKLFFESRGIKYE